MSELSRWEKFKIECAITARFNEHFNCRKCLDGGKDNQEQHKEFRKNTKGCFSNLKKPLAIMDNGTKSYMCLGRMYDYQDIDLINQYTQFKEHKILPEPGHINYQNAKIIEAFMFIESEIIKNENIKIKEANGKRS